ncbi:MAG: hypothetical protein FWE20_10185 [Defluviitaleaceae bacterium]|nr:hypothetical protein [Defluviitaleaceae bacterium]
MEKLHQYQNLAINATQSLTQSTDRWASFLRSASRLYKYPFADQVLIYAQKPDVEAAASYSLWRDTMKRPVRRGTKGIALIDGTGEESKLKYVFDYRDTANTSSSIKPFFWQITPENQHVVSDALEKAYPGLENWRVRNVELSSTITNIANQLASEYNGGREPKNFQAALAASTAYAVMSRCGIDVEHNNLQAVTTFTTSEDITRLGEATAILSQKVLREIEMPIKVFERGKIAEKSKESVPHVGNERNNNIGRNATSNNPVRNKDIRAQAPELSQRAQAGVLPTTSAEWPIDNPLLGDTGSGGDWHGEYNAPDAASRAEPLRQADATDPVGGLHDNDRSAGTGNGLPRIGLHLEEDTVINVDTPPEMLGDPETLSSILSAMRPAADNLLETDRDYEARKKIFENLNAFQSGTFTLFPKENLQAGQVQTPKAGQTSKPQSMQLSIDSLLSELTTQSEAPGTAEMSGPEEVSNISKVQDNELLPESGESNSQVVVADTSGSIDRVSWNDIVAEMRGAENVADYGG